MYPRDSTFATATLTGAQLAAALELFHRRRGPVPRHIRSACERAVQRRSPGGDPRGETGKPIRPTDKLVVTTNNLIATRRKGAFVGAPWQVEDDPPIREELIKVLTERGGVIAPDDKALIDPEKPANDRAVGLAGALPGEEGSEELRLHARSQRRRSPLKSRAAPATHRR